MTWPLLCQEDDLEMTLRVCYYYKNEAAVTKFIVLIPMETAFHNNNNLCCPSTMTANRLQSKTLISNWVEEVSERTLFITHFFSRNQRQCAGLDEGNRCADGTLSTSLHRNGHRGILASPTKIEASSTAHDSYTSPQPSTVRTTGTVATALQALGHSSPHYDNYYTGSREAALCSAAYELVSQQVQEEFHPPPPPAEYISTTKTDYHKGGLHMFTQYL